MRIVVPHDVRFKESGMSPVRLPLEYAQVAPADALRIVALQRLRVKLRSHYHSVHDSAPIRQAIAVGASSPAARARLKADSIRIFILSVKEILSRMARSRRMDDLTSFAPSNVEVLAFHH